MRRSEAETAFLTAAAEHLKRHVHHEGFEPVDSDEDYTIGWECPCREDGWNHRITQKLYRKARWSGGAWDDYTSIRAEAAHRMNVEIARNMWSRFRGREQALRDDPAEKKAKELLYRFLSEAQRQQFESVGYFEQLGGDGKTYRLWSGAHRKIELVENNEVVKSLCIHPKIAVPPSDTILAQKLLLQGDIASVYRIANITDRRPR